MIKELKEKYRRRKHTLSDKSADFLSRYLISKDFDKVIANEVSKVEDEPTVAKAQPIHLKDVDTSNIEGNHDIFVTDEHGSPLKFEIEEVREDSILLWVYNKWVRDGSVQCKVFFGNCQHPRISKWVQKLRVTVFDDSAVGVWHLEDS